MNTVHQAGEAERFTGGEHCTGLIASAQAELSAFMWTVHRVHGAGSATVAGEYWMAELEAMGAPIAETPDWRRLTIAAVSRLNKDGHLDHERAGSSPSRSQVSHPATWSNSALSSPE